MSTKKPTSQSHSNKKEEKAHMEKQTKTAGSKPTAPPPPAEVKKESKLKVEDVVKTEAQLAAEKQKADEAAKIQHTPVAAKPAAKKVTLEIGTPKGSVKQEVREGCAIHRIYDMLNAPREQALTVEQMAAKLHEADPSRPLASQTTNVRVEIAAFRSLRGMHVGRDAQGRYSFNITEQLRAKVLTEEQQKAKVEKDAQREANKKARLEALTTARNKKAEEKKAKKEAEAAAKKVAADAEAAKKAEDAKKTPEQVAAELAKAGVKAKVA